MVVYSLNAVQIAFDVWDKCRGEPAHSIIVSEENNCVSMVMYPNHQRSFRTFYEIYYPRCDWGDGDD